MSMLSEPDISTTDDFWNEQPHIQLPDFEAHVYESLAWADSLQGKRIGIPKVYIAQHDLVVKSVTTPLAVIVLWKRAEADLEALGATVVSTSFSTGREIRK